MAPVRQEWEERWRREEAEIANYPNLAEEVVRRCLVNRALISALLTLDTEHCQAYRDMRVLLDRRSAQILEKARDAEKLVAIDLEWDRLNEENERIHDSFERWEGEGTCSGRTQAGKPCTKRAQFALEARPYCSKHYPYPETYVESERRAEELGEQEWSMKKGMLARYQQLEGASSALDDMNRQLQDAVKRLSLELPPNVEMISAKRRKTESVRVDGIDFDLEDSPGSCARWATSAWYLRTREQSAGLLQESREGGWAAWGMTETGNLDECMSFAKREDAIRYVYLFANFYRVRQRRDLGWYREKIIDLVKRGVPISSPAPLAVLCGVELKTQGWHVVVLRSYGGGREERYAVRYSGASEAEARWEFAQWRNREEWAGILLLSPANEVVDDAISDRRSLWR